MIKFIPAIVLSLFACILTVFSAVAEHARFTTVLFRAATSMVVFGLLGFFLVRLGKRYLAKFISESDDAAQQNAMAEPGQPASQEEQNSTKSDASFKPLAVDQLSHVSEPKG